jgi:hypothetical protein
MLGKNTIMSLVAAFWLLSPNCITHAENETCFFRIVSTQQTRIVDFIPETGTIIWTNNGGSAASRIEAAASPFNNWFTVPSNDNGDPSGRLARATITNMIGKTIPFTTIGQSIPWCNAANAVIHNQDEWTAFCDSNGFQAPDAGVNFSEEMIVLSAMGTQSTGGYYITIERIVMQFGRLVIHYRTRVPGLDEYVIMVITNPKHFVRIQQCDLPPLWVHDTIPLP